MVADDKQIYHCFGCGEGGDVFSFTMKYEGLSFSEAVKFLADRAGVTLPKEQSDAERTREDENTRKRKLLLRVNEIAKDFFISQLKNSVPGKQARDYLQVRGIKDEISTQHFLGFAENSWDTLKNHLTQKRVPLELAVELGLLKKKDNGGYYDFFRGRLMFPIISHRDEIIGFGGRVIGKNDDSAKYLNSPDSLIYHKSSSVYGLDKAAQPIRQKDQVLLVEGYMDLISLRQAGFENAVAPLGTALTEGHIRLLTRYTRNFVLIFDGDDAGLRAAVRTLELFISSGLQPRVVRLPRGEDPDTFVQKFGSAAFEKLIANAVSLFEFFVAEIVAGSRLDPAGKVGAVAKVVPFLRMMNDPVERGIYLRVASARLGVDDRDIAEAVDGAKQKKGTSSPDKKIMTSHSPTAERTLIGAILALPEKAKEALEKIGVQNFRDDWLKNAAEAIASNISSEGTLNTGAFFAALQDEELASELRSLAMESSELESVDLKDLIDDCVEKISSRPALERMDAINGEIARAEAVGDEKKLFELLREKQMLAQKKPQNHARLQ